MVGDDVAAAVLDSAPEGVSHVGFIAFDVRDRVLVIEPEDHPSGVTATLPRAWVQPGDSAVDVFLSMSVGKGRSGGHERLSEPARLGHGE